MLRKTHHLLCLLALAPLLLLLNGCADSQPVGDPIRWADLVRRLNDPLLIARLDEPATRIITSVDPTGGNDDFNHFQGQGPEGWVVLADLKGPGYVSRLWMTGAKNDGSHPLRFYVDGEETPCWDKNWGAWMGGTEPMTVPIAAAENLCWYSYVPIPFQKRLVIMTGAGGTKPGGWPRLFYQVNHTTLPRKQVIESFSGNITPEVATAIEEVRDAWAREAFVPLAEGMQTTEGEVATGPGQETVLLQADGPAVVRELSLSYSVPPGTSASVREQVLRNTILRMTWDGAAHPSVDVPLGDFFGSFWRRTRYRSRFFGMEGDTFISRFPMPFAQRMQVRVLNQGSLPVTVHARAALETMAEWDEGLGYFHAAWNKTFAQNVGQPHDVLRTAGRGRFAGTVLSAASFDKSWWLLEGDESIRIDGEETPGWLGTGLEDYFNAGWYYQNVLTRPLHGLPFKAPFRVVQYRLHLPDPILFRKSIDVSVERGPGQASHGEMESMAFYYMAQPRQAASRLGSPATRQPPADPLRSGTLMTELLNHERLGDLQGAHDFVDVYLEQIRGFPFTSMLRLRQLAYKEHLEGFDSVKAEYERVVATETNSVVRAQAEDLLWFHESPNNALLNLYCNFDTEAFLDGRRVGAANNRERASVHRVQIEPGEHSLVLKALRKQRPEMDWVLAALRTHYGQVVTAPDWKMAHGAGGKWVPGTEDRHDWLDIIGTGVKGPPEVPFVWVEPNAMVSTHAAATGLRPPDARPAGTDYVVYRKQFSLADHAGEKR